ncbi:hypothetical protein E3V55_05540 [Candidatus Marinimicrobia bacterium MT.SAG.3]|nr:hypothetical protein E3V55_05540 [Candidatus Marinimicrobia bacterium MT.SAG.3]
MIVFSDIMLAVLVLIWFNLLRHKKNGVSNLLYFHSIVMFLFVLLLHMYSYDYIRFHPAITFDGLRYDILGRKFAHELNKGQISIDTGQHIYIDGFSELKDDRDIAISFRLAGGGTNIAPAYVYGIIGPIYFLFGHVPITIKIINVILFQLSFLQFCKILGIYNIEEKRIRKFQLIYLYMPTFMVYSASLMKEMIVLYATMSLLADIYLKRSFVSFSYHTVILLLTRIYNPVIILVAFAVANFRILLKYKKYLLFALGGFIGLSTVPIIGNFSLMYFLTDFPFAISIGKGNDLWFDGVLELIGYSLSHPSIILKTFFYGSIDLIMKPQPWYIQIPAYGTNMYPRLLARWLSSFLIWYIFWHLFSYLKNIFMKMSLFKFTIILTVFESIWMGMHYDMRYKFAFMPVFMILTVSAMHHFHLDEQTLKVRKMMFIPMTIFLALFASFFWGSDAITKVGF